jgi:hypothetical protein
MPISLQFDVAIKRILMHRSETAGNSGATSSPPWTQLRHSQPRQLLINQRAVS